MGKETPLTRLELDKLDYLDHLDSLTHLAHIDAKKMHLNGAFFVFLLVSQRRSRGLTVNIVNGPTVQRSFSDEVAVLLKKREVYTAV